ncbi:MAG: hypothetical protein JNM99_19925 [Verrucomicrobiaceae bacterium]|nr:hypothetical protein [Verrucomicrobiaceae bacterium]
MNHESIRTHDRGDFSIHGNPHDIAPQIDKFGRESLRFDHIFVNPFCAPNNQSATMTGTEVMDLKHLQLRRL